VLEQADIRSVPVAVGANRPLAQPLQTAEHIHGRNGLGGDQPVVPRGRPTESSAAEQIVRLARTSPGELELLATGPLTNIALALMIEPTLPSLVPRLVVMGGTMTHPGNAGPGAEANVWHDPEAAELVFSSGWNVTMIGLDVTTRVLLDDTLVNRLVESSSASARIAALIVNQYFKVNDQRLRQRVMPLHDPLAAAIVLDPSLCSYRHLPVRVELRGTVTRGMTVVDRRDSPSNGQEADRGSVNVAVDVDVDRLLDRFCKTLET
jgi:purine nucleosidase